MRQTRATSYTSRSAVANAVDVAGRREFGRRHQDAVGEFGIVAAEVQAADDPAFAQRRQHLAGRAGRRADELVEDRRGELSAMPVDARDGGREFARALDVVRGRVAQARSCRAARDRSSRSARNALGWCRCSRSPVRAGYAVRAPAASARTRCGRRCRRSCPTSRPGMRRMCSCVAAMKPTCGPP